MIEVPMKIDTLISIGVVIYIIISIRKALSQGKKTGGNAKSSGWSKLQEMAAQIKEEIEKANQQMQAQVPVPPPPPLPKNVPDDEDEEEDEHLLWDEPDDEDMQDTSMDTPSRVISQSVFYETKPRSTPPPVSEFEDEEEEDEENHRNKPHIAPEPVMPPPSSGREKSYFLNFRKKELKQAVVWKEILGKPLALRK